MHARQNLLKTSLVLLGLCAAAIALPLLATLGEGATFFVAHRATATNIIGFAFVVYLVPPTLLVLLLGVLRRIHLTFAVIAEYLLVGLLSGLWLLAQLPAVGSTLAFTVACAMALLAGWLYASKAPASSFLQLLGLVSPLLLVSFLFFSPVKKLLINEEGKVKATVVGNKTPVVMLVLDELSQAVISTKAGDIDAKRLPNFARLAALSTWYSNTTTVSTQTQRAVPAILAGMRVDSDTQPVYSQFPQNMFTVLATSHKISALETVTRLCPKFVCEPSEEQSTLMFDRSAMYSDALIVYLHVALPSTLAERWLPSISSSWSGFSRHEDSAPPAAEDSAHWFMAMIADMSADDKKRFQKFLFNLTENEGADVDYFHLALPHIPWIYLPDGTVYNGRFAPGQSNHAYDWGDNQHLVNQGVLRYGMQVEFVDQLLGEMLDTLINSGRMDDILLVVTSDHGVSFAANKQRRIPVAATLAGVARVPLFIKYPGQTLGERDDRPVETIDVFPTVADVLGLSMNKAVDGQSLIADDWKAVQRSIHEAGDVNANFEAALDMDTAIKRISAVVPPGKTVLDSMGLGAGQNYLGKSLSKMKLEADTPLSLDLDRPEWYANVDVESGFLPARLTGTLAGAHAGTDILIALNGVVAGSSETYGDEGRISVMLDPRRFQQGVNHITPLTLVAGALAPLPLVNSVAGWEIELDDSGEISTVRHAAQQWKMGKGLIGSSSHSPTSSPLANFEGWAYDTEEGRSAAQIVLLKNGEAVSNSFLRLTRPLVAADHGLDVEAPIGFSIELDPGLRKSRQQLSVVALFDGGRMLHLKPDVN
ncbi:MAG: sulfatase-like hydrolase/transferase [Pseudomonadales bacterium]